MQSFVTSRDCRTKITWFRLEHELDHNPKLLKRTKQLSNNSSQKAPGGKVGSEGMH